jgi:hypothetical protein
LNVDRLLEETDSRLFEEWRQLYELEPWADEREDLAAGEIVCATIAAAGGNPKGPRDYMPFLKRPETKPQSEDEMKRVAATVFGMAEKLGSE